MPLLISRAVGSALSFGLTGASSSPPGAPTNASATATGQTTATVSFCAPVKTGGKPITGYTATSSPGSITGTASASPISMTGLTAGTSYTFTIKAANIIGSGPYSSASNSITTSGPYWVAYYSGRGSGPGTFSKCGNVYVALRQSNGQNSGMVKYNAAGVVQSAVTYSQSYIRCYPMHQDSSGNMFAAYDVCNQTTYEGYDTNMNVSYYGSRKRTGSYNTFQYRSASRKSGNVTAVGAIYIGGGCCAAKGMISNWNGGSLNWEKYAYLCGRKMTYNAVDVDSSGNSYAATALTFCANNGNNKSVFVHKYNSSGCIVAQRGQRLTCGSFGTPSTLCYNVIKLDSSNNIYVGGRYYKQCNLCAAFFTKMDSNLNIAWSYYNGNACGRINSIAHDASNNVYVGYNSNSSEVNSGGSRGVSVSKFNSSGSLIWARAFKTSSCQFYNPSVAIDNKCNLLVSMGNGQNNSAVTWKLPNDGSLTGTYTVNGVNVSYLPASSAWGGSGATCQTCCSRYRLVSSYCTTGGCNVQSSVSGASYSSTTTTI